jgi:hypothetical protein
MRNLASVAWQGKVRRYLTGNILDAGNRSDPIDKLRSTEVTASRTYREILKVLLIDSILYLVPYCMNADLQHV